MDTSRYGHPVGTYAAYPQDPSEWRGGQSRPPDLNGSIQADTADTLTAYFVWTGDPAAVPDHADFLIQTHVSASAGVIFGSAGATRGLSATATATLERDSATANAGDAGSASPPALNNRHLVRVKPVGTLVTLSKFGSVSTDTANDLPFSLWSGDNSNGGTSYYSSLGSGNGQTSASASANVSASANNDNRDVSIICQAIETSYYKGIVDTQHSNGQWPHIRNADGSIVTDSVAFYGTADNNHGWNAGATFNANVPGFTNPVYSWASDFNPVAMLGVDMTQSSIAGSWYFGSADKLPANSVVTLNVQDGPGTDGLSASNTFGIKWHLPYEAPNPVPYLVLAGKYSLQPARVGPVSDGETTLVQPMPPHHIDWEATIDGASVVAKVAGQEEIAGGLEIVGAIAKVAKPYTDVDSEPKQEDGATNGPVTWGDAQSENQEIYTGGNVPDSLKNDPYGWQLCNMYIFQVVHYKDKYWYADGYNSHGYDGNSQHVMYLRNIDGVYDEFQFIQYKTRDGSPIQ